MVMITRVASQDSCEIFMRKFMQRATQRCFSQCRFSRSVSFSTVATSIYDGTRNMCWAWEVGYGDGNRDRLVLPAGQACALPTAPSRCSGIVNGYWVQAEHP